MDNMDIIGLARELGRQIQQSDAYLRYNLARQAADEDKELQKLIADFNMVRVEAAAESAKPEDEKDNDLIRAKNTEMMDLYNKIMTNKNMKGYNEAKDGIDAVVNRVTAIIAQCAEGEDPDTTDYDPSSCSGSCGSCGGCGGCG